jgi:hypothetical protein
MCGLPGIIFSRIFQIYSVMHSTVFLRRFAKALDDSTLYLFRSGNTALHLAIRHHAAGQSAANNEDALKVLKILLGIYLKKFLKTNRLVV